MAGQHLLIIMLLLLWVAVARLLLPCLLPPIVDINQEIAKDLVVTIMAMHDIG